MPEDAAMSGLLVAVLEEAQTLGLVGPGPVQTHLDHARGFAELVAAPPAGRLLDLGSGGGLPGLVLALTWPRSRWVLLDGRDRSVSFLRTAVQQLNLADRVTVVGGRAEVVAHDPLYRRSCEMVVARSVAAPAAVAECAAGFLAAGGRLVVSEPPNAETGRWNTAGLARVGMGPPANVETDTGFHFCVIEQQLPCPPAFPRRTGVPANRPLF